jgi:hypothetical protein
MKKAVKTAAGETIIVKPDLRTGICSIEIK